MATQYVLVKPASPSGLTITRNKKKFTFSWKRSGSPDAQQLAWRQRYDDKWGDWKSISVSSTATSKTITLDWADYFPTKKVLGKIEFRVRGKKEKKWSDWATKEYDVLRPNVPKVTAELSDDYSNVTTFSWNVNTSDTDQKVFVDVQWQSILQNGYSDSEIKAISNWSTIHGYQTGTSTSTSSSKTITEISSDIDEGSHTRWFRVRARGPQGSTEWAYAKHVYAKANQAIITSVRATPIVGGTLVNLSWSVDTESSAFPIDSVVVQYSLAVPAAGLTFPSGGSWTEADTSSDKGKTGAATFEVNTELDDDECLWVKVDTVRDGKSTNGVPTICRFGALAEPTNLSVATDNVTHKATVTCTNNSAVPDSFLAVKYCSTSNPQGLVLGIIPHSSSSVTMQCPDWSEETAIAFEVFAVQGSYTSTTTSGVTEYRINPNMRSESISDGGAIPVAPKNVTATPTDEVGTVQIRWDWTWTEADGAEISWSDYEYAWESTGEPSRYEVDNIHTSQWNVTDLEPGKKWYFRVRLFSSDGNEKTFGAYSNTKSVDLSSAPTTPILMLSNGVIPEDGMTTATWAFMSTDGTSQMYAEICEATYSNGQLVYGDIIASTTSAQHIDLHAQEVGWHAGEVHYLCLRVQSASGKLSDSWSDPVPVIIAEPMTCTITGTSLVPTEIAVNPRFFASAPIVSFETDMEEEVTKLEANITPLQDLHGYDKPWVGGAGKNKVGVLSTKTQNGVTVTNNGDGSYTISGTPTALTQMQFDVFNPLGNGTYTMSLNNPNTSPSGRVQPMYNGSALSTQISFASENRTSTFTSSNGIDAISLVLFKDEVYSSFTFKPQLETGSTATSWTPWENLCPITGWTGCEVDVAGVNLLDPDSIVVGKYINASLQEISASIKSHSGVIPVKPNTSYCLNGYGGSGQYSMLALDENKAFITWYGGASKDAPFVATTPANARYMILNFNTDQLSTIAFYESSTVQGYIPYNGTTYPVSWQTEAGTVYGGTVDLVTGVLTVTHGIADMGDFTWIKDTNRSGNFYTPNLNIGSKSVNFAVLCSQYNVDNVKNANTISDGELSSMASYGNPRVFVKDNGKASLTATQFKTAMSGVQLVYELATPTTYQLDPVQVACLLGQNNVWADCGDVAVNIAEDVISVDALTELPLSVTVSGAGDAGAVSVALERADNYFLDRPDGSQFVGYQGETVALSTRSGDGTVLFDADNIIGMLDDGAHYRIVATTNDLLGQSATDSLDFWVVWEHQALIPTATISFSDEIARITPIAPTGTQTGDTCDIYRLSADKPELILRGAAFGTQYVDPYPTLGDFGGYRIVFNSMYGDYITADNILAWTDYGKDDGAYFYTPETIIDFNGQQVRVMLDMTLTGEWGKDFKATQYLGGSTKGDWNPAVGRTGTVNATTLRPLDADTIESLHDLADYAGICKVRMPDGTNVHANVDVSLSSNWGNSPRTTECTLSFTRVDSETLDGLTYAEWNEGNT